MCSSLLVPDCSALPLSDCSCYYILTATEHTLAHAEGARPAHSTNVPPVFDGQSATTMDEALLRNEPLLSDYWAAVGWLSYSKCSSVVSANKSSLQARQLSLFLIVTGVHVGVYCTTL